MSAFPAANQLLSPRATPTSMRSPPAAAAAGVGGDSYQSCLRSPRGVAGALPGGEASYVSIVPSTYSFRGFEGWIDPVVWELLHGELVRNAYEKYEEDKATSWLESLGFSVGRRLADLITIDVPPFRSDLDVMKFLCREFWSAAFRKSIDNLRTNHQGIYELHDSRFKFLKRLSVTGRCPGSAPRYLAYTCGLLRGALSALGVNAGVTAEVITMPGCLFKVDIYQQTY